jgi:hypothetical protein
MRHLKAVLEELDIQYSMPLQPVLLPLASAEPNPRGLQPSPSRITREALGNAGFFQVDHGARGVF